MSTSVQGYNLPDKKSSSFIGDVSKLVLGTLVLQGLNVIEYPILTRIYAPSALGISTLFASIATILSTVICLGYQGSIMLPEDDDHAAAQLNISLGFVLLISLILTPIFIFTQPEIMKLLNAPVALQGSLWLMPLQTFVQGVYIAFGVWYARYKRFGLVAIGTIAAAVVADITQIAFGLYTHGSSRALIFCNFLSFLAPALVYVILVNKKDWKLLLSNINIGKLRFGMARYKKFPLMNMQSSLLNTFAWQLPTLLLTIYFSSTVTGYYALGYRVLSLPMMIVGSSISSVFYSHSAAAKNEGNLPALSESTFENLVKIGLFAFLILAINGREIVSLVFGSNWQEAGVYVQILSIWLFFWFISNPIGSLYTVLEKQEFLLGINIAIFVIRYASLTLGGLLKDARLTILLVSFTGLLTYGYLTLSILSRAGVPYRHAFKILWKNFVAFIPAGIFLGLAKLVPTGNWLEVVLSVLVLLAYGVYLLKTDARVRQLLDVRSILSIRRNGG